MFPLRYLRRLVLALLCPLLVATAVGCRPGAPATAEDERSTLTIVTGESDWIFSVIAQGPPTYLMFLPLVAINERGELEGRLAQSWELAPDDSTWTIRLRSDVKWHDGVPVTAHDVKFTMDLRQHPDVLAWEPGRAQVTVLDDTTFTVIYRPSYGEEPDRWTDVYGPKHLLEGLDPATIAQWDFWLEPVGNGPYRFVRHVPFTVYELEANPDFYLGRPRIDRVILKLASQSPVELLSGNVDAMRANPILIKLLADDARFRVYHSYYLTQTLGIAWNQDRYPPFRDRRVRRALTQAIDRRELLAVLDIPDFTAIYDVAMSIRQFRRGEYPDPVPHDPDAARRLLEEAGWRDEDGDGIRERDGEEFRFTILVRRRHLPEATYVQEALRRVGIAMAIEPTALLNQVVQDADFEAVILWFFPRLRSGNRRIGTWLGPESPIGYHNPSVDSLLVRAQGTRQSLDELEGIYRQLMPIMQEDLPITFLRVRIGTYVAHRRVRGLTSPWRASPYMYIDQLWLEEEG